VTAYAHDVDLLSRDKVMRGNTAIGRLCSDGTPPPRPGHRPRHPSVGAVPDSGDPAGVLVLVLVAGDERGEAPAARLCPPSLSRSVPSAVAAATESRPSSAPTTGRELLPSALTSVDLP